tara:strand:+ start:232 stop:495 length:264 start_codon:yes stop_codon:yes gene_type:complete
MKVKTLINKLLNYDMNAPVELVILGEDGERYSRYLSNNCVDESGGFDDCPIIFDTNEVKDGAKSIQDLIDNEEYLSKECLKNKEKNE